MWPRSFLLTLLLLPGVALRAEEQTTEESMSPDCKHEVVFFRASSDDEAGGYTLRIRVPGSEQFLHEEPGSGYVGWGGATSKYNYKCLWSPDSRFVAVFIRDTKRSGNTEIFAFHGDKVEEVTLPDLDQRIRPHLQSEWRSSWLQPELWLPRHELMLVATGTQNDEEHGVYRFVLGIRLRFVQAGKTTSRIASFRQDRSIPFSVP